MRLFLAVAALLSLSACSSSKPAKPVVVAPKGRPQAEYVSGIAAAYYCTCREWPDSWNEMWRFDNYLHARSESAGERPLKRFAWAEINADVSVHSDGSLIVSPKSEGHLEEKDGGTVNADDGNFAPIAVPVPDCSRFDPTRFASGCGTTAY